MCKFVRTFLNIVTLTLFMIAIKVVFHVSIGWAQEPPFNTLLLFIGEDQDIMSIASGREESAWQAPAVATVVEKKKMNEKHFLTLSELIDSVPGFHVVDSESGIYSYLRGIPDSIRYLYDTVPTRFADEISLHSIKRVEIVRGPGSVLWGPDAFAGIVNVVPMTGKDIEGIETGGLFTSHNNKTGVYLNYGRREDSWNGFLSVNGSMTDKKNFNNAITKFWGTDDYPVPVEERRGTAAGESERHLEILGNFFYKSWFNISARLTDSYNPYSLSHEQENISWKEINHETTGFLKVEGKKRFGINSALRFTGMLSVLDSKKGIVDTELDHDEYETYGEIAYEKVFNSGDAHFTSGVSFRNVVFNGVLIWDNYLPGFFVDENDVILPTFNRQDYVTRLWSGFIQYKRSIANLNLIFGLRTDHHDSFKDKLSYNAGAVWDVSDDMVVKLLMGTAYRTPKPRQLFSNEETELEEIQNISMEVSRKFGQSVEISLAGFLNQIDNHVMDDPYAGLSNPNSQEIKGVELSCTLKPSTSLSISMALTFLENHGPLETYLYNDYSTLQPDGTIEKHFVTITYPYDAGPEEIFNIDFLWQPADNFELFSQIKYHSAYELSDPFSEADRVSDSAWLLDAAVRIKNVLVDRSFFEIKLENILDREYMIPGEYILEPGKPFSISISWRKLW